MTQVRIETLFKSKVLEQQGLTPQVQALFWEGTFFSIVLGVCDLRLFNPHFLFVGETFGLLGPSRIDPDRFSSTAIDSRPFSSTLFFSMPIGRAWAGPMLAESQGQQSTFPLQKNECPQKP